ncbi:MAG: hypothetical protein AAF841_06355 [Pseudomonadota bacterium]
MISRLSGALLRAFLVVWLIATPALLLSGGSRDAAEGVALIALFAAIIAFIEYGSEYPSLVDFRHAPPFNRLRFGAFFIIVFLLSVICRGFYDTTAITEFVTAIAGLVGHLIDFPYSPVRNMILMLPAGADPALLEAVRMTAGLAYLLSILAILTIALFIRLDRWPARYGTFNVWVNLPTFDPTAGGDVVERLHRVARLNLALGFLLPFVIPALLKIMAQTFSPLSLDAPQALIWTMAIWAFFPASLFMRGIAMGRVARMIEDKRRQRYAEFGEEGVLV